MDIEVTRARLEQIPSRPLRHEEATLFPSEVAPILEALGIPLELGRCRFSFSNPITPRTGSTPAPDGRRYLHVASTVEIAPELVAPVLADVETGAVWLARTIGDGVRQLYLNTGVPELIGCCAAYETLPVVSQAADDTDDGEQLAEELLARFTEIDPSILVQDDSVWPEVVALVADEIE